MLPSEPPERDDVGRARAVVADLEAELAGIAESTADGPDDEHDAEGSTVGYERARVGALLDLARRRLADLEDADVGDADPQGAGGRRCTACGRPIPAERLAALPGVRRCVECSRRPGGAWTLATRSR